MACRWLNRRLRDRPHDRSDRLGRDLIGRGLAAPRLVVADGAPRLISAVEEIWPRADRQHCAVHRLRNLLLPR
jgi:transposase-like protein